MTLSGHPWIINEISTYLIIHNWIFKFSGQGCSMEQMSSIRDQQESLAKLHFEIGARQDPSAPLSEEGTPH